MKHGTIIRLLGVLVAVLACLTTRPAGAATVHTFQCGGWSIVPSPQPYNTANVLEAVGVVAPTDVWAVGYGGNSGSFDQPLIAQWNGVTWQVVPSPNAPGGALRALTVLAANNVWAVGDLGYGSSTLIEHWDGSQWNIVPSPSVGNFLNDLAGVVALSPNDVWAVGFDETRSGGPYHTLVEHWDGGQWSVIASPNPGASYDVLRGVAAVSPRDVWVVGSYALGPRAAGRTLTEHWDGTKWNAVPAFHGKEAFFAAITATDATHVWGVGKAQQDVNHEALIERWNGNRWLHYPRLDPPGTYIPALLGVAASTVNDIWAVGTFVNVNNLSQTLTEHWDGTSWQAVASPNQGEAAPQVSYDNYLNGVAMTSAHTAWAVGYYQPHNNGYTGATLIEYYC